MKIAHYEIVEQLGAGGMGEVYRARDPKLGRDVAIKVLPGAFLDNPERRARFEREARVLASINHPHIGAIYGVEDADGYRALVLELIEGETLAGRITTAGRLPVDEALGIARQIAEALEAAHEKGIVHRDLKPANIMLNAAGSVKVVDFGLARFDGGDASGSPIANSPTLTYGGTVEGVILGTAVYLSPEQARGRAVDKRADIWAFGCVLFEMLTGLRVFGRETVSDSIAAILGQEPDWKALPADLPNRIEHLLRRCLTKDPRRRLHDIADARIEIEDSLASPQADTPPARQPAAAVVSRLGVRGWLPWVLLAIATVALLVVSTLALKRNGGTGVSEGDAGEVHDDASGRRDLHTCRQTLLPSRPMGSTWRLPPRMTPDSQDCGSGRATRSRPGRSPVPRGPAILSGRLTVATSASSSLAAASGKCRLAADRRRLFPPALWPRQPARHGTVTGSFCFHCSPDLYSASVPPEELRRCR